MHEKPVGNSWWSVDCNGRLARTKTLQWNEFQYSTLLEVIITTAVLGSSFSRRFSNVSTCRCYHCASFQPWRATYTGHSWFQLSAGKNCSAFAWCSGSRNRIITCVPFIHGSEEWLERPRINRWEWWMGDITTHSRLLASRQELLQRLHVMHDEFVFPLVFYVLVWLISARGASVDGAEEERHTREMIWWVQPVYCSSPTSNLFTRSLRSRVLALRW